MREQAHKKRAETKIRQEIEITDSEEKKQDGDFGRLKFYSD